VAQDPGCQRQGQVRDGWNLQHHVLVGVSQGSLGLLTARMSTSTANSATAATTHLVLHGGLCGAQSGFKGQRWW
jgi:hypothetical protein